MGFRPHDYTIMASAQVPFGKVEFTFIYVSVCLSLDINNFPTMNIFRFVAEESSCLIYVICRRAHVLFTLFVGGLMSYLRYL